MKNKTSASNGRNKINPTNTLGESRKIIFFGNGPLAEASLDELRKHCKIIFHARTKEDLKIAVEMKEANPAAIGVLASFGQILGAEILAKFEPEGILNIHPSLLPKYRGPSPIETTMLTGGSKFGVSVMKIAKKMDAGPVFWQNEIEMGERPEKLAIYERLARAGAEWISQNLNSLPEPKVQDESAATYTHKLDTGMARLKPTEQTAEEMEQQVRAFAKFPKTKWDFYGKECAILRARVEDTIGEDELAVQGKNGRFLIVEELQPNNKKAMNAKAFLNGYRK